MKKLILLLILLFSPCGLYAQGRGSLLLGVGGGGTVSTTYKWVTAGYALTTGTGTSATYTAPAFGAFNKNATESSVYGIVSDASGATFTDIIVNQATDPGAGAGTFVDYTLVVNGSTTALTCRINGSGTGGSAPYRCTLTGQTIAAAYKQTVSVQILSTGTPTSSRASILLGYKSGTTNTAMLTGNSNGNLPAGTAFGPLAANVALDSATGNDSKVYIVNSDPAGLTVTGFCIKLVTGTGAGGSRDFFLMKNSVETTATVNFPINDPAATKCDVTHTVAVAQGDTLSWESKITSAPTASKGVAGIAYTSGTTGNFILPEMSQTALTSSATRYVPVGGVDDGAGSFPTATEANEYNIAWSNVKLTSMCALLQTAAGGATTYDSRANSTNMPNNFHVSIATSGTSGCVNGGSLQAAYDFVDTMIAAGASTGFRTAISYTATMNYTANAGGSANTILVDYGAGSNGTQVTAALMDPLGGGNGVSTYGIYGTHYTISGGGANLTFATASHHTLGGNLPAVQYYNPWPGELNSTVGQNVAMQIGDATLKQSIFTLPTGANTTIITASVWFQTSDAIVNVGNPDVFTIAGSAGTNFSNITLGATGSGSLTLSLETPNNGGCTGHASGTNVVNISTNTWYLLALQYGGTTATNMYMSVYDANLNLVGSSPTGGVLSCFTQTPLNVKWGFTGSSTTTGGYNIIHGPMMICGALGETCTFPLLPL